MKKLLVLFGFLISTSLNGQFLDNYGIRAGLNSSNQYWELKTPFGSKRWRDNRTGFEVYLTGEKAITKFLSFRSEIGYKQSGFTYNFTVLDSLDNPFPINRNNVIYHNLSSSVSFKLKFLRSKFTPYINVGLHFKYLIGYEEILIDYYGTSLRFFGAIHDFNKLTIDGLLGVGVEYNKTFFIDLDYKPSITNNINDEDYLVFDRSFALTVGLNISKFIVSKKQKAKNKKYRQKSSR